MKVDRVAGFGINDYNGKVFHNGKIDPVYDRWKSMLWRCYKNNPKGQDKSYTKAFVSEDWLYFSNFKKWLQPIYYEGCCLDKDLIGDGNLYSEDTCVILKPETNGFLVGSKNREEGVLPRGVHRSSKKGKPFYSDISFKGKKIWLGCFNCPNEAGVAWLLRKAEHCDYFTSIEEDPKVKKGLVDYKTLLINRAEIITNGGKVEKYF